MTSSKAVLQVKGARQLRRTLRQAGDDLTDLKATHRKVAGIVTPAAAQRAPVVSGALMGSVRPGATKTAAIVRAGRKRVPYAGPIHWGWAARHIKANPFLSLAATSTEPRWRQVYFQAVEAIVSKVQGASTT